MLVIDASIALAWCLSDEGSEQADIILDRVVLEGGLVPAIWPIEIANAMHTAERRGRLTAADIVRLREVLRALPIEVAPMSLEDALGDVISLGRAHALSAYDASYLAVAAGAGVPLATLDRRLAAAAAATGVELAVHAPA